MQPSYDLNAARQQFPFLNHSVYLSTCAIGPLPAVTRRAIDAVSDALTDPSQLSADLWNLIGAGRDQAAALINAHPDEIAQVQNTAEGMNIIAHALPLQPGDNVVMCDQEYPAVVYPFMNQQRLRGVEARIVPHDGGGMTLDLLERHADARTRAVAVSTVEFVTGFRADLVAIGEWCRARNIWLVVDGIQSLGAAPMDVKAARIDALATGSHKWMLGPLGAGFLYVNRDRLGELTPPFAGASSVVDAENYLDYNLTFLPNAQRFELGVKNMIGIAGLGASLGFLRGLGIPAIEAWTLHLTGLLIDELDRLGYPLVSNRHPRYRSAIVSFRTPNPEGVPVAAERLKAAKVTCTIRSGCLRLAAHGFNSEDDIRAVAEALGPAA